MTSHFHGVYVYDPPRGVDDISPFYDVYIDDISVPRESALVLCSGPNPAILHLHECFFFFLMTSPHFFRTSSPSIPIFPA